MIHTSRNLKDSIPTSLQEASLLQTEWFLASRRCAVHDTPFHWVTGDCISCVSADELGRRQMAEEETRG